MILSNRKERGRFLKFAIVGTIGALIDFGLFNLLKFQFNISEHTAQALSFSVAVISNFIWNRLWTYPEARQKPVGHQMFQFVVVSLIGLGIRTLIFDKIEELWIQLARLALPAGFLSPEFVGYNLTLATVIIIILFWNFFANRFWTYNDVSV